jgi:hypothetical protein
MAGMRQQIEGLIKTCETAIASKREDVYVDENSFAVATAILKKAKADLPNDEILAAATLDGMATWVRILSVMQIVLGSLPNEPSPRSQAGGGGGETWMR